MYVGMYVCMYVCMYVYIHVFIFSYIYICNKIYNTFSAHTSHIRTYPIKETKNVTIPDSTKAEFWEHYEHYRGDHPACAKRLHNPVGFAGDDGRYNLAGNKVIVMLLGLALQAVRSLELCRCP